ncbi:MAG TPA: type II toxin-antitoxin system PemK/MazF family toxin [Tepidiformaceae bacterium]|nr:type II toxin-antitoxin system PemK/MazF family toxin [Tepidiformaceae bacterium]
MRRGEIWSVAGGGDYADKPRPAVILQSDEFDQTDSITLCGLTTNRVPMTLFRVRIVPTARNGLRMPCHAMLDKIWTVRKTRLGYRIGLLDPQDMVDIDRAIVSFLGIASSSIVFNEEHSSQ